MPPDDDAIDFPPSDPLNPPDAFAEFDEDDLAAEHTAIDERDGLLSESTQIVDESPPMPLLFVEAGRDRGREYVLVEGETTIGRGIDNEVILADVSVSRRHLKIVREDSVLALRDLGSGNGTMVNGRKVASAILGEGDRIELGETVLVVRVPGANAVALAAPESAQAASEHTTDEDLRSIAGASLEQSLPREGSAWSLPPIAPGASLVPPPPTSTAWLGGDRTGNVVVDRRMLMISAAGIAIGASVLGALVVAVALPSPPPVASTLPVEPSRPSVAIAPPVPSTRLLPPAPPRPTTNIAVSPERDLDDESGAGSTALSRDLEALDEEAAPVRRPRRWARSRRARTRLRVAPPAPASAQSADAALEAYRAGDFAAASRQARAAGLPSLATQIDQFATQYRAAGSRGGSIAAIERAIALDNQIIDGGHYGGRLRPQLVGAYLEAAQSQMSSRPQDACRRVQLALRLDEDNARGSSLARQCEQRAQQLVNEASGLERSDANRSLALYRSVLTMVPESSAAYARARRRIEALGRRRSVDEDE